MSVEDEIRERLWDLIEPARQRPGFMERLQRRIREDKPILDRLSASERPPQRTEDPNA